MLRRASRLECIPLEFRPFRESDGPMDHCFTPRATEAGNQAGTLADGFSMASWARFGSHQFSGLSSPEKRLPDMASLWPSLACGLGTSCLTSECVWLHSFNLPGVAILQIVCQQQDQFLLPWSDALSFLAANGPHDLFSFLATA